MKKIWTKILAVLVCAVLVTSLSSCDMLPDGIKDAFVGIFAEQDEPACEHRDANDDFSCDGCGAEFSDQKDIEDEPLGCRHRDDDGDGVCDDCPVPYTEGVTYERVLDHAEVTGYDGEITEVVIASKYEGAPVTVIRSGAFSGCASITSVEIPSSVTHIEIDAFRNCASLADVDIGDGVKSIGDDAFEGCDGLTSLYILDVDDWCTIEFADWYSNPLYYADNLYVCHELRRDVVISADVSEISEYAFIHAAAIESVSIPMTVTRIGEYAFFECENLKKVYIEDIAAWCDIDFANHYSNPLLYASLLYIGGDLADEVEIPEGVTAIPDYAFSCDNIESVIISDTVSSIGESAFENCGALTSVRISPSVTSIGDSAFYNCEHLAFVYIDDVAAWCGIDFPEYTSNPLNYASRLYIGDQLAYDVVIPEGVASIPALAFSCDNIKSIIIPDSVTYIGGEAFSGCENLTSVSIGKGVAEIDIYAFEDCVKLESITISESVTSIGYGAFHGCEELEYVTFENTVGWWVIGNVGSEELSADVLKYSATAADYLTGRYCLVEWKKPTA